MMIYIEELIADQIDIVIEKKHYNFKNQNKIDQQITFFPKFTLDFCEVKYIKGLMWYYIGNLPVVSDSANAKSEHLDYGTSKLLIMPRVRSA